MDQMMLIIRQLHHGGLLADVDPVQKLADVFFPHGRRLLDERG